MTKQTEALALVNKVDQEQPAPVREDWGPGPHEYHSLPESGPERPAQRKPLTDEQIVKCWGQVSGTRYGYVAFARAIEAKLKEKNSD